MFVYFIQRKGFLDGDRNYLRNRLHQMRGDHGQNKFHSFYRYFLLRLFHEGLGGRERSAELEALVGRIPYRSAQLPRCSVGRRNIATTCLEICNSPALTFRLLRVFQNSQANSRLMHSRNYFNLMRLSDWISLVRYHSVISHKRLRSFPSRPYTSGELPTIGFPPGATFLRRQI